MLDHGVTNEVSHLPIEAAQQNAADHNGRVVSQPTQEAGTLQCHIRGANHQGAPWGLREGKNIITRNG
jgi:hypothetical protein